MVRKPRRPRLMTDFKPKAAEQAVKDTVGGEDDYARLRTPMEMRRFLQDKLVQRYRERNEYNAVALGSKLLGLVFEEGFGQFHTLPALDLIEIKSETGMVAAWLAGRADDKELFEIALKELRKLDSSCRHSLARLYRLHAECIGVELFSAEQFVSATARNDGPKKAYDALNASFKGLKPLPNVVRAATVRYAKSLAATLPDFDRSPAYGNKTLHQWLATLRDEGLQEALRRDDGYAVGSVVVIEVASDFVERAMTSGDVEAAHRYYSAACQSYAELFALHRAGRINNSPNVDEMLTVANTELLTLMQLMNKLR